MRARASKTTLHLQHVMSFRLGIGLLETELHQGLRAVSSKPDCLIVFGLKMLQSKKKNDPSHGRGRGEPTT